MYSPPQMPSLPSGLGTRVPVGPAGGRDVVGNGVTVVRGVVGTAAGSSLTQYVMPGLREQVEIVGLSCMNCVTVKAFAEDSVAQVSPALAITVRVHVAAKTGPRHRESASTKPGYRS